MDFYFLLLKTRNFVQQFSRLIRHVWNGDIRFDENGRLFATDVVVKKS